jgi:hypothetical protein
MAVPYTYHPQSSGKVEKANHTLEKNVLSKITQELQLDWSKLLLLALLCTCALPPKPLLISPSETIYGCPLVTPGLPTTPSNIPSPTLSSLLLYMRITLWTHLDTHLPKPTSLSPANPDTAQMGEWVYYKGPIPPLALQPPWKGPLQVILTIPTVVILQGYKLWVHVSSIK